MEKKNILWLKQFFWIIHVSIKTQNLWLVFIQVLTYYLNCFRWEYRDYIEPFCPYSPTRISWNITLKSCCHCSNMHQKNTLPWLYTHRSTAKPRWFQVFHSAILQISCCKGRQEKGNLGRRYQRLLSKRGINNHGGMPVVCCIFCSKYIWFSRVGECGF